MIKRLFFIICVLNNVAILVRAQNIDSSKHSIGEAIVRATRTSEKTPFAISTVDKKEIALQNNGVDLPILLNTQPAVVTNSDAGNGIGYTGIRIRGSDISRINVTMNGVPVNDAEGQGVFFVNLPDMASNTQSIQIQRGVGGSSNGSSSFGASININTLQFENKKQISFQNDYSSFNTWRNTLLFQSGLLNKKIQLSGRISHLKSDGYIQRSYSKLWGAQATASYKINNRSTLIFNFMSGKEKTGQAWNGVPQDSLKDNRTMNELGIMSNGQYYPNQSDNYQQQYYQLFLNNELAENKQLNLGLYTTKGKGYYEEYKTNQPFADYFLPDYYDSTTSILYNSSDLIRQLWLNNRLIGGFANYIYKSKHHIYTLGLAGNNYTGQHYGDIIEAKGLSATHRWYDLTANKYELSTFVKAEINCSKQFLLYADAQVRNVNYTINGFRKTPNLQLNLPYLFLNPKLGFNYTFIQNTNQQTRLYASFAMAHKEPNRDDLEASKTTVPQPETLYDWELGISFKNKYISILVNGYYMNYKNQLVNNGKINDVGAYTRVNVANSYRKGIEVDATYSPNKIIVLKGNITLSENKIKSFNNYTDDYDNGGQIDSIYTNTTIAFSPNTIASCVLQLSPLGNKKTAIITPQFSLLAKYIDRQYLDNTQNISKSLSPYTTLDFMSSITLKEKENTQFQLRFGVFNLLNHLYESNGYTFSYIYNNSVSINNYYFPQSGRRFTIGAGVVF